MATLGAAPKRVNIAAYRGDETRVSFRFTQSGVPMVLPTTGWTSHIRAGRDFPELAAFDIDAIDAATGLIIVSLSSAQSELLEPSTWYYYDLQLVDGDINTYVWGNLQMRGQYT